MSDSKLILILDTVKSIKFKLEQGDSRLKCLKDKLDELSVKIGTSMTKEKLKNMIRVAIVGSSVEDENNEDDDEDNDDEDNDDEDDEHVKEYEENEENETDYLGIIENSVDKILNSEWNDINTDDIKEMIEDCLYNDDLQGKLCIKTLTTKLDNFETKVETLGSTVEDSTEYILDHIKKRIKISEDVA